MSPVTLASSHINYSSSARRALPRVTAEKRRAHTPPRDTGATLIFVCPPPTSGGLRVSEVQVSPILFAQGFKAQSGL